MMDKKNEDQKIITELESLQEVPDRDPAQAARARSQFLLEAKRISEEPVSISWFQRLSNVFEAPQLRRGTLTIAIILGLLFVSFTTSAAVARQALPDEALYPFKIWLENQRLALTTNPEREAELHLIYAQERLTELEALGEGHSMDIDELLENYNHHLAAAEESISESELEDLIHSMETLVPNPSPEDEEMEPEHEQERIEEPTKTPEPEDTEEPDDDEEETKEPEDTAEPESTPEPEGIDEPGDTEEPDETNQPDPTEDSEETDDPEETDEPDETEDPEETEGPSDDDDD